MEEGVDGFRAERRPPTAGDDGFDLFYREHHHRLVRLAFLLTQSAEAADDLVHDVFVRVYPRWAGLRDPEPYLRRSVVNASTSWWRRRRIERRADPVGEEAVLLEAVGLEADELFDVLAHLSARQRAAVVLRYYEGLSDAEVATFLHCRPGTVASLVHRALEHLRAALAEPVTRGAGEDDSNHPAEGGGS